MYRNTRFVSLMKGLSRKMVEQAVNQYQSDKACKGFNSWRHLVSMIYGQLSGARSLRELEAGFNNQSRHHYHLGCKEIKRSTLSDANSKRSYEVFKCICEHLISQAHKKFKTEASELLYLLDSSPISLKGLGYDNWSLDNKTCRTQGLKLHVMIEANKEMPVWIQTTAPNINDIDTGRQVTIEESATYIFDKGYYDYNWWFRIETKGAKFVTRFKSNAGLNIVETKNIPDEAKEKILEDSVVTFKNKRPGGKRKNDYYGTNLRKIVVQRDDKKPMVIATNDMQSSALEIADLYKRRWGIELFFKWIKQNLKIKQFLGRNENAVKIQLYTALITYLLARIYKEKSGFEESFKLFIAVLRVGLFQQPETEYKVHKRRKREEAEFYSMQGSLAL